MSLSTKFMIQCIGMAVTTAVLAISGWLVAFPLSSWSALWTEQVIDLPIIVLIVIIAVTVGAGWGFLYGLMVRNHVKSVTLQLRAVSQGRPAKEVPGRSAQELAELTEEANKIYDMMLEQGKTAQRLSNELAEGQEKLIQKMVSQERNRLARELHDSVSQQLFAASMMMSAVNETRASDNEVENRQLSLVEQMIHQSQLEMRALLLHLRPVALKGKTLSEGIEELLLELKQKVPLAITWKVEEAALEKGVEDHLFRILQESVSNTLRHANASSLDVLCVMRDDMMILRITDNGQGFDLTEEKTGSYGLQNMKERSLEIGGTIKIVSLPSKGTRIEVKVPYGIGKETDHD